MSKFNDLYTLVTESYNNILKELNSQELELQTEMHNVMKKTHDKFKIQVNSKTSDYNESSNEIDRLNVKLKRLNSWKLQYQKQVSYLVSKRILINNILQEIDVITQIFNYESKLNSRQLLMFDEISLLLNMMSGLTPAIISQKRKDDQEFLFINNLICSFTVSTKSFDYNVYGWDPITKRGKNSGNRYLSNCKVFDLKTKCEIENNESDMVEKMMAISVMRMLEKTTAQARYGNIWIQILSLLFYKQLEPSSKYYSNLPDCIYKTNVKMEAYMTYSFQTIIRLLSDYNFVPFRVKRGMVLINKQNTKDWSTQLPILLSILVNGVVWEMTGVLDKRAAVTYIYHMLTAAQTSTIDYLLKWKSKFRKWIKLAISKSGKIAMLSWELEQPNGLRYSNGNKEIFFENEQQELRDLIDLYPTYYKEYVNHCFAQLTNIKGSTHIDAIYRTLLLRHFMITSHSISCGSNYNKTSPALCLMDASGTKINTSIITPRPTRQFEYNGMKLTLDYAWSDLGDIFNNVMLEIHNMVDEAYDSRIFKNIEHEFVSFLTNKSGGGKYNENFNSLPFEYLPREVQKVSQTRIINFLLTSKLFYTLVGIDKLCEGKTTAGYREQIDRRMRVIAVVRNIMQLLTLPLILIFNEMKGKVDEIAMGKQVGNILDAIFQIESSSTAYGFMTSSDVSGMDASVLKQIAQFVRHSIVNRLDQKNVGNDRIFAFNNIESTTVTNISKDGTKTTDNRDISALKVMTVYLETMDGKNEMEATDGYFTPTVAPSDQTFKSGELFTSGNHTVLLIAIVKSLLSNAKWQNLATKFRVLGDDFFMAISNGQNENEVLEFLLELRDAMKPFNLILELDGSRFSGDFLQQSALCGLFVPKPSRSSVQNVERNDVADRNPIDIIKMVIDTSAVSSNRVYSQENIVSLIRSIWFLIRTKKYVNYNDTLLIKYPKCYKGMLNMNFTASTQYIILPFILISVSPINYPPILLDDIPREMIRINFLTPGGDFMYNYWFQIFMRKEIEIEIPKKLTKQWLSSSFMNHYIDWNERNKFGITLSEHLMNFKRKAELSEHKVESIGSGVIKILQDTFIKHADQDRLKRSRAAVDQLFDNGINIPSGLTFEGRERHKVILSFEAKLETQDEQEYLDRRYIEHINKFDVIPISMTSKYLYNSFIVTLLEDKRHEICITKSASTCDVFYYMPIIPACHRESPLLYISRLVGFVNKNDYRITASINRLGESAGFGFDVDRAVEVGVHICKTDYKMLDIYTEALGLGIKDATSFKTIVQEIVAKGYKSTYQSVFPLNKYFITPGDAYLFTGILSKKSLSLLRLALPEINIALLCRDILFAYGPLLQQQYIDIQCSYLNWLTLSSDSNGVIEE